MNALAVYCFISFTMSLILVGLIVYAVRKNSIYIEFREVTKELTNVELVIASKRFILAKLRI